MNVVREGSSWGVCLVVAGLYVLGALVGWAMVGARSPSRSLVTGRAETMLMGNLVIGQAMLWAASLVALVQSVTGGSVSADMIWGVPAVVAFLACIAWFHLALEYLCPTADDLEASGHEAMGA